MTWGRQLPLRFARTLLFFGFGVALACPTRVIATDLPIYGGLGGIALRADCPMGSYLVGLAGRTGEWVDRIAPVCAPWLRGSQTLGPPSIGPSFGTSGGGQERQAICTGGGNKTVTIQSWWIHVLRSDNHYVQYVEVFCTSLTIPVSTDSGWRLGFGNKPTDVEEMVTGGPFTSQPPFQACPAGEAAVGFRVRAGQFVDAIGLICGPLPARAGAPVTKVDPRIAMPPVPASDMFVVVKPGSGDKMAHGQLVVMATAPKVGMTTVTELELRYLDAPASQQHAYPYTTIVSVETGKLLNGYAVSERVTGGYLGRWQVRVRSSMKAVPGAWSLPVQFQMVKAQPPPPMVQMPMQNAPILQAPAPNSSMMPVPPLSEGGTTQMRRSPSMIMPRGADEKEGTVRGEPPTETLRPDEKP
ncbi:hypothetical protein YTPLAS18_07390 [Nitrospira sp.]|nr:hypothetical protein YTPLAS18_07390 [Nitrospira sp.]